jgi:16S rRNA (adenine1518-N6/adenine1519-N6)-dimethyltransferase
MNYDSPTEIRQLLEARGLALKKRFGQNFLINRQARERIVGLLGAQSGERVWEIGPGLGAMTGLLLESDLAVTVFELDHGFVRALRELYPDQPALTIVEGDALDTMDAARAQSGPPARLLGNLPYSSASRMIAYFIESELGAGKTLVTVQKDLALRMRASPGDKIYSSFSVFCQSFFDVRLEFDLKGGNFYPRPEVDSTVVSLLPDIKLAAGPARDLFFRLIRLAFGSRRKTLNNNLFKSEKLSAEQKSTMRAFWESRGLSENARAEELAPDIYRDLASALSGQEEKATSDDTDERG